MPFRPSPLLHAALPAPTFAPPRRADALTRARELAARLLHASAGWSWIERYDGEDDGALAAGDAAGAALGREVVARGAPLVVPDARRVSVPSLARALDAHGWRAFLGVPLRSPDGAALGTLAVVDVRPRAWSEDEVASLAELAALTALAAGRDGVHGDPGWLAALAQREAQEARRKSEEWLALIFNCTPDVTFLVSVDGRGDFRYVAVNDSYLALTGRPAEEVVGRSVAGVLPAARLAAELARYHAAMRAGEPIRYEERLELPVGSVVAETTLTPIVDEEERVVYLLGVSRDVTARQRAEEELRAAHDAALRERAAAEAAQDLAERANRAKSDFLSRMSHELRTPLNAVIGFANVLRANQARTLGGKELGYLDRISANGRHLLSLISDLLDISRIEAGKMPVTTAPVPLAPLVRTTLATFEPQLVGRPLALRVELPAELQRLDTDATKLQQVLLNLVSNALKFTERGAVTVRVVADGAGRPLRLEVEDSGVGIAPDRQEAVFRAFEQEDTSTARVFGGTGLGLTISRSLCELLGYRLTLHSVPGEGSRFTIHFDEPTARAA